MKDVERLEALAKKASPGPWKMHFNTDGEYENISTAAGVVIADTIRKEDGEFIVGCSPDVVLRLCRELRMYRDHARSIPIREDR